MRPQTTLILSIDEATNNANDKILNTLVHYFDKDDECVILEHLDSRKQPISNAEGIFSTLEAIMADSKLPWSIVVSVLLDNRSVMRGCKAGIEARVRTATGSHLLTWVATLSTCCRMLSRHSQDHLVSMSPRARSLFFVVQNIVGPTKSALWVLWPVGSQFLQMILVWPHPCPVGLPVDL